MSELLRDIEKELKRERWLALWRTYRRQVVWGAGSVLVAGVVFAGLYLYNQSKVEAASADFDQALIFQGKISYSAFEKLAAEGGIYGALASFHQAAILGKEGRWKKAAAIYDSLAENPSLTQPLRDLARIYAAQTALGRVPYAEIEKRLGSALSDSGVLRWTALELVALAALADNQPALARSFLTPLIEEENVPATLAARAQILLNRLNSQPEKTK